MGTSTPKVPSPIEESFVTAGADGGLRNHYGAPVQIETDPLTGITRYATSIPMIVADMLGSEARRVAMRRITPMG